MGPWVKNTTWWCATCGEKYDSKQPNTLLVVQTGDGIEQAKVFKAHAVPQGPVCKVDQCVENQQEDGLLQNIVTDLGKGAEKVSRTAFAGLHEGGQCARLGCWSATPRHGNV